MEVFSTSRNDIKKFSLNKNFIQKQALHKQELSLPIDLVNKLKVNPEYRGPEIDVVYEDTMLLVLNKPPGIHCHPLRYDEHDNCLSFLRMGRGNRILKVNEMNYDRGLLYRLDYGTSGLLFYIKDPFLHKKMRERFSLVVKEKYYLAIVKGQFVDVGTHKCLMEPFGKKGEQMRIAKAGGFPAHMEAELIDYNDYEDVSLVKVRIFTGVRHQVRFQLADLEFPILGDELYGGETARRMYLHCFHYVVEHGGEIWNVQIPPGDLFKQYFNY